MKIAFIGFGEAGRAFATSLARPDLAFSAYDTLLGTARDSQLAAAAMRSGVELAPSPKEAVAGADWILSAVTAADCMDAARSMAGWVGPGQIFIDINSVSAGRKRDAAAVVEASGAAYVDMAVMAPVHPRGHATPSLLAGPHAASLAAPMADLGFDVSVVSENVGDATSIKMVRSMFVKGLEAVTVQALLAAEAAGCFDEVYTSLAKSFAKLDWPDFPAYQLERVTRHGVRRAAEMRESAATMDELGLGAGGELGRAIARLHDEVGSSAVSLDADAPLQEQVRAALDALRAPFAPSGHSGHLPL